MSEALEQQTATSEVLQVISSSPGELEPVFQTMLENATHICGANFGNLFLYENETFRAVAMHNAPPAYVAARMRAPNRPGPNTALGRLGRTKQVVQIADLKAEPGYIARDPFFVGGVELGGIRTLLAVPMLKENELIGAIIIYRQEVRPFTHKQIELVTTFADQAVIAIENARLLNELRQRTDDLSEALEQQTATSDVLGIISSSPGELEPVFQAMLGNATRICGAKFGVLWLAEGDGFRSVAMHGLPPAHVEERQREPVFRPGPEDPLGRLSRTKQVVHIADLRRDEAYIKGFPPLRTVVDEGGGRTLLVVPMLKDNALVGAIAIYTQEVRPFTDKQIELVSNFAKQAVIAIENTRLLNDLRESLEQQTATSEVLQVISKSPGELEPVFQSMLENAVRICEAGYGTLFRCEGGRVDRAASVGTPPALVEFQKQRGPYRPEPDEGLLGRVFHTRDVAHTVRLRGGSSPRPSGQTGGCSIHRRGADAQGRRAGRGDRHLPDRGSSVHRQADRACQEFRQPSRHRHREHPPAPRTRELRCSSRPRPRRCCRSFPTRWGTCNPSSTPCWRMRPGSAVPSSEY